MSVQLASKDDLASLKNLWMNSFEGERNSFCDRFFEVRTSPDRILVLKEQDSIISALHMLPCSFRVEDDSVKAVNLVGAATSKDFRGRGHMEMLLGKSIKLMKERNEVLCCLKPFLHKFYRKYGWETCSNIYKYILKNGSSILGDDIKADGSKDDEIKVFKEYNFSLIKSLNSLYEKYSPNVLLKRSVDDWDFYLWDLFFNDCYVYMAHNGYAICILSDNCVKIVETLTENEACLKAILVKISHDFQSKDIELNSTVKIKSLEESAIPEALEYTMIRIIDLKQLCGRVVFEKTELKEGVYELIDSMAPWNMGKYMMFEHNGMLSFKETSMKADYICDISYLTGKIFNPGNTIVFEGY